MSGENENGNDTRNISVSWILCCILALGSPVALVGIIILTFTRKDRDQNRDQITGERQTQDSVNSVNNGNNKTNINNINGSINNVVNSKLSNSNNNSSNNSINSKLNNKINLESSTQDPSPVWARKHLSRSVSPECTDQV